MLEHVVAAVVVALAGTAIIQRFAAAFEGDPPRRARLDANVDAVVQQMMQGSGQA
jgi:hypothetical protein